MKLCFLAGMCGIEIRIKINERGIKSTIKTFTSRSELRHFGLYNKKLRIRRKQKL
jgi:hypothetical protein